MLTLKGTTAVAAVSTAAEAGAGAMTSLGSGMSAATPGPLRFFIVGIAFSAQTGVDYRRLKRGDITRKEFKSRMKRGAYSSTGNIVGGASGMVGGFVLGQMLIPLPVLGGVIGTVVGGIFGTITGVKVAVKMYEKQELKMAEQLKAFEEAQEEAKLQREALGLSATGDATSSQEAEDMSVLDKNHYELSL